MAAQAQVDFGGTLRPQGRLDDATALQTHRGVLGTRAAAHLLRRAGFGGTPAQIRRYAAMDAHDAAASLLEFPSADSVAPPSPLDNLTGMSGRKAQPGAVRDSLAMLQLWWLNRMLTSPAPLQEKMALYFHGHFTSLATPRFPQITYDQNALFRRWASGNLRELTREVSVNPAMLVYLNGAGSVVGAPNENYARELMELFTLGVNHYTENDVRESARAWTGWRVNRPAASATFDPQRHDYGRKTFLGQSGNFNGNDVVSIIFGQPQCARFFATSLLNFFVYNDPETALVDGVAALLREHDFELTPVLGTILRSNVFYSERAYRGLVKSPVEFVVGTHAALGLPAVDAVALPALMQMGQRLYFPPNVAGWPGGSTWLTSGTMIARQNFLVRLLGSQTLASSTWLGGVPVNAASAASQLSETLLQGDVAPASLVEIERYLSGAGSAALASLSAENYGERVTGAVYLAMATPAYQLN